MRIIAVLVVLLICGSKVFSQDLSGEWKGSFTDDSRKYSLTETRIIFNFSKINDSTFKAFSISYSVVDGKPDSAICILQGGFTKKNVLYLEETRVLKYFGNDTSNLCNQLMKLYFNKRRDKLVLQGDWFTEQKDCGYGSIRLTKSYK